MSADVLRRAASRMRELAEAATPGGPRWETAPDEMHGPSQSVIYPADSDSAVGFAGADDAAHIAAWHPAVALAVADWLDGTALIFDLPAYRDHEVNPAHPALAVARAFLGEES